MRALVFAYHNVGVRCLSVLLAHGVEIPLVVTHRDARGEHIWFDSVAALCERAGVPWAVFDKPEAALEAARRSRPDALFSFYYRELLSQQLLDCAPRGAWNMHGSLLPKYRGRVPVNWAVLHGESHTGATLHEMVKSPDAGAIVDQAAVPILPNDTAHDVFQKVTCAAEVVLDRCLDGLLAGTASPRPQDLRQGRYFGARRPEDGRIDPGADAWSTHNLVRAVAPPYPGAFCRAGGRRVEVLRTWWPPWQRAAPAAACLEAAGDRLLLRCADGAALTVVEARVDDRPLTAASFPAQFAAARADLS